MADETVAAAYDATNVSLGKPGIDGVLFRAPYGTELPTNATDPLPAVWKSVGYISEDGITNSVDTDNTTINDMGGTAVLNVISSYVETYQFTMIETNVESLKARYGDDNVVVDTNGKPVSVKHKVDDGSASSWVKEIAMTGGRIKRTVIPNSTRSEFGDLVDVGTDAIGYALTTAANPDPRIGNATSIDYLAQAQPVPSVVPVAGVALDTATLNLAVDGTRKLVATVTPDTATNKNVMWASDHEDIATVDQTGLVTARKAGKATITVTTEDGGKTATCAVTVA